MLSPGLPKANPPPSLKAGSVGPPFLETEAQIAAAVYLISSHLGANGAVRFEAVEVDHVAYRVQAFRPLSEPVHNQELAAVRVHRHGCCCQSR